MDKKLLLGILPQESGALKLSENQLPQDSYLGREMTDGSQLSDFTAVTRNNDLMTRENLQVEDFNDSHMPPLSYNQTAKTRKKWSFLLSNFINSQFHL